MKYSSYDFFQVQPNNISSIKIEEDNFDIKNLNKCPKLNTLEIFNTNKNNIDLSVLENLKEIKNIAIFNNKKLKEIVFSDYQNKSITKLILINNALQSIPKNIEKLTSLRHFSIERNNINDISDNISELSFEILDFSCNNLSSINQNFYKNTYLTQLNLSNNHFSSIEHNGSTNSESLNHIFLGNNYIQNFNLNLYTNKVKTLFLNKNKLNAFPECIQEYSNLEELDISNNPLIKSLPNWLTQKLPSLKTISINGMPEISINKNIHNLSQVEHLDLSFCELEEFPEGIISLSQLKSLKLNFNSTKKIPNNIHLLTNIEYLELQDNDLETLPEEIYSLPKLKEINLEYNNFPIAYIDRILGNFSLNNIHCII